MNQKLWLYLKYPSAAGIIITIWLFSGILMVVNNSLPVMRMVTGNLIFSLLVAIIGFRVDRDSGQ